MLCQAHSHSMITSYLPLPWRHISWILSVIVLRQCPRMKAPTRAVLPYKLPSISTHSQHSGAGSCWEWPTLLAAVHLSSHSWQVRRCHVAGCQATRHLHDAHQGPQQPEVPRVGGGVLWRGADDRRRHHQPVRQLSGHDHRGQRSYCANVGWIRN